MDSLRERLMLDLTVLAHQDREDFKQPSHLQKAAFETKESNYWLLHSDRNMSRSCTLSTFIFFWFICVHLRSPVCTDQCSCPVSRSAPLVHSNYTLYYLGLSSQQAHLKMRFKTVINIELCVERKKREREKGVILKLFCWGLVQITTGSLDKGR